MQVTSALTTSCLQHDTELPDHIFELKTEVAKHENLEHLPWRFCKIMIVFTNFRFAVTHGMIADPDVVLPRALELNEQLVAVFSDQQPY